MQEGRKELVAQVTSLVEMDFQKNKKLFMILSLASALKKRKFDFKLSAALDLTEKKQVLARHTAAKNVWINAK